MKISGLKTEVQQEHGIHKFTKTHLCEDTQLPLADILNKKISVYLTHITKQQKIIYNSCILYMMSLFAMWI